MNDAEELSALLMGFLVLELSDEQVQRLGSHFGTRPLDSNVKGMSHSNIASSVHPILGDHDFEEIEPLWRQITHPSGVVIVERQFPTVRMMWTMLIDKNSCVEQVRGPSGFTWLFCSTMQLLGRVLLNSGILRDIEINGDPMDPIADAEEWELILSVIPDLRDLSKRDEFRYVCRDGKWMGLSGEVERSDVSADIVAALSAAFDSPAQ